MPKLSKILSAFSDGLEIPPPTCGLAGVWQAVPEFFLVKIPALVTASPFPLPLILSTPSGRALSPDGFRAE